jgi:hypothetical protein
MASRKRARKPVRKTAQGKASKGWMIAFIVLAVVAVIHGGFALKSHARLAAAAKRADELSAYLNKPYTVHVANLSDRAIGLTATVSNLSTGDTRLMYFDVAGQGSTEIASGNGWAIAGAQVSVGKKTPVKK